MQRNGCWAGGHLRPSGTDTGQSSSTRPQHISGISTRKLFITFKYNCQWRTQEFCSEGGGALTNSVEDRGQREQGSGGGSPLVIGSAQFTNE
jgi:hypothetical protein